MLELRAVQHHAPVCPNSEAACERPARSVPKFTNELVRRSPISLAKPLREIVLNPP